MRPLHFAATSGDMAVCEVLIQRLFSTMQRELRVECLLGRPPELGGSWAVKNAVLHPPGVTQRPPCMASMYRDPYFVGEVFWGLPAARLFGL